MNGQIGMNLGASLKKQVPAETIHDLNDKKIHELTEAESKQVREDWAVHFNDLDYRDGRFKVAPKVGLPVRFHDKVDAIKHFYALDCGATLFESNRILMTRDK